MRRLVVLTIAFTLGAFAIALGGCEDSCIDTGCVEDSGPDVKEAGKKDAAKDTGADVKPIDAPSDVVSDVVGDAPIDGSSDGETDATSD